MSGLARMAILSVATRRHFKPSVFALASFAAAVILVAIVAVPQWQSKQARWEVLRSHVGQIGQLAVSAIDGDVHRHLLDPANYSDALYAAALKPLVRFHSANPDLFYVYTMVDRDDVLYFVLDTAASADLRTKHKLRTSTYMKPFALRKEYQGDWLQQIAAGKTYVTPTYEHDDYGYFLTAHAPIYDSRGNYSGFVGVDFDLQYYLAEEARFRAIGLGSLAAALIVALLIGYLVARYDFHLRRRMEKHYRDSIRDGLTGLLNRRGAMEEVSKSLARRTASYATLLVDIDNLKRINDRLGHVLGDKVISQAAEAIDHSIRMGDSCARLGGDEFMVFAPDCKTQEAEKIASRILANLSALEGPGCTRFSVSIGIAVQNGLAADFDRMYSDADSALYYAKRSGKGRVALFKPSMAAA